jgi:cytochrome c
VSSIFRSSGPERRRTACAGLFLYSRLLGCGAHAAEQVARGEQLYQERCGACHALDEHGAGPKHRDLLGRRAGTQPDYDYSPMLAASKIVWSPQTLERWIADPNALVPGNRMVVRLANDPADRAAIVAYLISGSRASESR